MRKIICFVIWLTYNGLGVFAQSLESGAIQGRVYNSKNNEPVPFASVVIFQTTIGAASNFDGEFKFTGIKPGFVRIQVSAVGYETYVSSEIMVSNSRTVNIEIPLVEANIALEEVVIRPSAFRKTEESPVSLRVIGIRK